MSKKNHRWDEASLTRLAELYCERKSFDEIAEAMGLSYSQVAGALYQYREKLELDHRHKNPYASVKTKRDKREKEKLDAHNRLKMIAFGKVA